MKKLLVVGSLFALGAFGETFNGTIMDNMCHSAGKDPATHPAKCAMACSKSGYGLVMADGKYVKFDQAGNDKALAAMKASDKKENLKATVNGTMDGDTLKVESVSLD